MSSLFLVGDLHLGRSPHRLAPAGLDPARLDPAEAWRRLVDAAVAEEVTAVVLAGDVVDQDRDRFEAWGHLRAGVERLVEAGIGVLGVAGNHDHIALPRLVDRIPDFHLLGRGGRWERVAVGDFDLLGWSFPQRHHRGDPLDAPGLTEALEGRRLEAAAIGVIHCDLDAGRSPYAPVRRADLAEVGLAGWFLGHVHQPGDLTARRPLGYLGSLVGLDRSETGPRGPWRVTREGAEVRARQLALGPVHWVDLDLDLSGLEPGGDAPDRLHAALESRLAEVASQEAWVGDGPFSAVGCSVRLSGRTAARAEVRAFVEDRAPGELVFPLDGVPWAVVHLEDATRPTLDLAALGAERTPLGQLARLLVDLDARGDDALPAEVAQALEAFQPAPWTPDLERHPLPPPLAVARRAALGLLEDLLAQQERA